MTLSRKGTPRPKPPIEGRFWARVNKNGPVHPTLGTACWVWTGSKHGAGYGLFYFDGGVRRRAHVVSLMWAGVTIPAGMEVDHLCRNRACVRPDHLEVVTHAENVRRGLGWSGVNARKTHCPAGHPYNGKRTCRECRVEHARARYRANPEKFREVSRLNRARAMLARDSIRASS